MSSLPESSIAMPITCSPSAPYLFCNSTSHGASISHGPHQIDQKFHRTALPRKSDKRTFFPSSDSSVKSGAGPDFVIRGVVSERRAMWKPKYSMPAATKATKTSARGLRPLGWPGGGAGARAEAPSSPALPSPASGCGSGVPLDSSISDIKQSSDYKAKRFRNDSQLEISEKRPITSNTPSAIR